MTAHKTEENETVTTGRCNTRHKEAQRQFNRVWAFLLMLGAAILGGSGLSTVVAYDARQAVEVRKAAQEQHNQAVIESLKEIKAELVRLRNGK